MRHIILLSAVGLFGLPDAVAQRPVAFPQTKLLTWEEADLSSRLMDGAHRFVERKIAEAPAKRGRFWTRDFSAPEAYAKSVQQNRERFRTSLAQWIHGGLRGWNGSAMTRIRLWLRRLRGIAFIKSAGPCWRDSLAKAC